MRRALLAIPLTALVALLALAGACGAPSAAAAGFGIEDFDVRFEAADGSEVLRAGAHPYAMKTSFKVATKEAEGGGVVLDEAVRDLLADQITGFAGNPTAVPPCSNAGFLTRTETEGVVYPDCPDSAVVGRVAIFALAGGLEDEQGLHYPVYNLLPSPGQAARLGFWSSGVPVTISLGVSETYPYEITGGPRNISQIIEVAGTELVLWGVPADPDHDTVRGRCLNPDGESTGTCAAGVSPEPFLTMPRACGGPLATEWRARSWAPGSPWISGQALTHEEAGNPRGIEGCGELDFAPDLAAVPSATAAESPSGLRVTLEVNDEGLANPSYSAAAAADISEVLTILPPGVTANPGAAEGLGVCSGAQYAAESLALSACPAAAKIGTLEAETPLLEEKVLRGSVYLASPDDNPFGSLIALYFVLREPQLGIFVKLPVEVATNPATGQLFSRVTQIPPFPLSRVQVDLRSGPRAPLLSPPACGVYPIRSILTPSSGNAPIVRDSSFAISSGPGGGPCPDPNNPPFSPGFSAGAISNSANSYSPFVLRLTRQDGHQDLVRFSSALPRGVLGKIAGVSQCPEAQLALLKVKTGIEERDNPSCPANSLIGKTWAGAGVGSQLTYVPGRLYLAGPYNGAPLSVVAVTPAVAGPFDVGVVAVREALTLDPKTAQVSVDGAASDPIPHILAGIPLSVRDVRVMVDRPQFTRNPTNCSRSDVFARIGGGGLDPFSTADDTFVDLFAPYQAADCAALGFKPKLGIKLRGGVKRGAHPALRAVVTPRPGDANFSRAVVTLPRSAFLEQGHIRTICTRVQFAAGPGNGALCPKGAQYGYARAWSPLLDAPAQGPVYLRSSDNKLPDLVVALKGPASAPIDVELSARIDSVRGGIRSIFTGIPDVPVSRFILDMQGGKKGLIVNSRHLCFKPRRNRARSNIRGQNGRFSRTKPVVRAVKCQKRRKAKRRRAKRAAKRSTARVLRADKAR